MMSVPATGGSGAGGAERLSCRLLATSVALFLVALLAMVCAFVAGWLIVVRDKERRSGR
jgi:ABC-type transporter Mla maintaining outer membrane lipid asymmetry permease subunit MlaE